MGRVHTAAHDREIQMSKDATHQQSLPSSTVKRDHPSKMSSSNYGLILNNLCQGDDGSIAKAPIQ